MDKVLRIGIAGLGTVGASVFRLLQTQAATLENRCGKALKITAVSARSKKTDRGIDVSGAKWVDDPVALASDPNVDVVVELIGGAQGPAHDLVVKALEAGKPVVTANKALLARHGLALAKLAEKNGAPLFYEAAVAGGIPIIKGLREGLSGNNISAIFGILNGTCNFILSEMQENGDAFEDVLKRAQELGYAESDPSFDIDGLDAGHKLCILSALAFGHEVHFDEDHIKGIRHITQLDIEYASELGYRIKLLGIARRTDEGIEFSVEPCMVPKAAPIASVSGALNAVYVEGDFVGQALFAGPGAGGGPTASAVVADIVDIARGYNPPVFGIPAAKLQKFRAAPEHSRVGPYYLRLTVLDQPGVMADIAVILRDHKISIESVLQRGHDPLQPVPVILTTHKARESDMLQAVRKIGAIKAIVEEPRLIRMEILK